MEVQDGVDIRKENQKSTPKPDRYRQISVEPFGSSPEIETKKTSFIIFMSNNFKSHSRNKPNPSFEMISISAKSISSFLLVVLLLLGTSSVEVSEPLSCLVSYSGSGRLPISYNKSHQSFPFHPKPYFTG
jgi:hypothetical protein